jgi:peptidoglycan hydrolase-like protein with peptidoglycan-binding domain
MSPNRTKMLYSVLGAVAGAALAAWIVGSRIESPADAAARTAAPTASPILVPVEMRVLSSEVVTRGTVRYGLPQPISIGPSPLKPNSELVTTIPTRGAQFGEGALILTASGRPVFLFQGALPAYRDLSPGVAGEDVRQLKRALTRLGFNPGSLDGPYDEETGNAVAAFYKAKGWEAFGPTRDQLAAFHVLERDYADAMKAKAAADAAIASAELVVESARATATHNTRSAALDSMRTVSEGVPADAGRSGRSSNVEAERARAHYANSAAEAELTAQMQERDFIVLDPRQTEQARAAAEAKLELAKAAVEKTRRDGELAVQAAERDAGLAVQRAELGRSAEDAAKLEGEKSVQAAIDAKRLAALDAQVAAQRAEQLGADLRAAKLRLGVQIPVDEIVFVKALPVRVDAVTATVGGALSGPVMTVTDNQLSIDASLPLDTAPLVKPGMGVAIDEESLRVKATGTVDFVDSAPATHGVDGFHVYVAIRVNRTPARLEGYSVRLKIPIEATKGAVLAVPVSAVSLAPDGTSRVQVATKAGLSYVTIKPGLSSGGYVAVTPIVGSLAAGQQVVVGYENPANKDGSGAKDPK